MAFINLTPAALVSDFSAALGLLASSAAVDVVGVYNSESLAQVFTEARPLKAAIRETSKTMVHPIEQGALIPDHRIIEQSEIYLSMLVPAGFFSSVFNEIKNLFKNGTLLAVQTRVGVYQNVYIADIPHEETPEIFDAVTMVIHLKEVFIITSASIYAPAPVSETDPKAGNLTSNVSNGQVSSSDVTPPAAGVTVGQAVSVPVSGGLTGWTSAVQSGATGAW